MQKERAAQENQIQHEGNGLLEVRRDTKHNKEERKGGVRPSESNLCFTVLREVGLASFSLGMTPICLEKRKKEGRKDERKKNYFTFLFFFWILVPRPGIEPITLQWKYQHLNHWTTREVPRKLLIKMEGRKREKEKGRRDRN